MNEPNSSTPTAPQSCVDDAAQWKTAYFVLVVTAPSVLIVVGVVGNTITICVLNLQSYKRNIMASMLRYMAFLDNLFLCTALAQYPLRPFKLDPMSSTATESCFMGMFYVLSINGLSNWTLVVITLTRVIHLKSPSRAGNLCTRLNFYGVLILIHFFVVGCVGIMARIMLLKLPPEVYDSDSHCYNKIGDANARHAHLRVFVRQVATFILPAAMLLSCNILMVLELRARERRKKALYGRAFSQAKYNVSSSNMAREVVPNVSSSNRAREEVPNVSHNALERKTSWSSTPSKGCKTRLGLTGSSEDETFKQNFDLFKKLYVEQERGPPARVATSWRMDLKDTPFPTEVSQEKSENYFRTYIGKNIKNDVSISKRDMGSDIKFPSGKTPDGRDSRFDTLIAAVSNNSSQNANTSSVLGDSAGTSVDLQKRKTYSIALGHGASSTDVTVSTKATTRSIYKQGSVSSKGNRVKIASDLKSEESRPTSGSSWYRRMSEVLSHPVDLTDEAEANMDEPSESGDLSALPRVPASPRQYDDSSTKNLTLMLLAASGVFMLLHLPMLVVYNMWSLVDILRDRTAGCYYQLFVADSVLIVRAANHSLNFFFYCTLGSRFRRDFYSWLRGLRR